MATKRITLQGRIDLGGISTPFKLLRVARRRHVHVMVDDEGELLVRAPWRYSLDEAVEVIREHGRWVEDTLRTSRAMRRKRPTLVPGSRLPLLDEQLVLVVHQQAQIPLLPEMQERKEPLSKGTDFLRSPAGTVYRSKQRLCVEPNRIGFEVLRELLEGWFRQQAARFLPERLDRLAEELAVRPARVRIRSQKTRWGSCSSDGEISLNWRLVLLPSELADYILVHELCHLRHMDHSSGFWSLVATLVPDHAIKRERIAALQPALAL